MKVWPSGLKRGEKVLARDATISGRATGGGYPCRLESCPGTRAGVRWSDGTITFPCTRGMYWDEDREGWRIV